MVSVITDEQKMHFAKWIRRKNCKEVTQSEVVRSGGVKGVHRAAIVEDAIYEFEQLGILMRKPRPEGMRKGRSPKVFVVNRDVLLTFIDGGQQEKPFDDLDGLLG